MITSLAIILLPVQAREKFLEQVRNNTCFINFICSYILYLYYIFQIYKSEEDTNESIWVVVDSEGEEDSSGSSQQTLRESDIIAFLNQMPFSVLFKKVFNQFSS